MKENNLFSEAARQQQEPLAEEEKIARENTTNIVKAVQKMIYDKTGLELKTLEQDKLRLIADEVQQQLIASNPSVGWGYGPVTETFHRFLLENYGIDINPMDRDEFFGGSRGGARSQKRMVSAETG